MRRALILGLALFLVVTSSARADCSVNPSDVAPGALEPGMPDTWRVNGDGSVTVRDLVTLIRARVDDVALGWTPPVTAGCPTFPADTFPGSAVAGTPPLWSITGDGDVTDGDVDVARANALGKLQYFPGAGRPLMEGARSLAGQVLGSNAPAGLQDVTVTVTGPGYAAATTTSATGEFLVTGLPLGTFSVVLDGSTASAAGVYPELSLMAVVAGPGTTDMPPATLPDLSNPEAANAMVPVDGGGKSFAPFTTAVAGNMMPDLGVSGPAGSKFTIGGAPATMPVMLNVTPVPGGQVPMALPDAGGKLNPSSFVTIQPGNAAFDTSEAAPLVGGASTAQDVVLPCGLNALLPNGNNLPVGTMVDVWSFDHGVEDWVNRSEQTGNRGVVTDIGGGETAIVAPCVILEGGWHAPVVPVDPLCATRLRGRVLDALGAPLAGVFVGTSVASFGVTGPDGTFSLDAVPAYSGVGFPGCQPIPIVLTLTSPVGTAHETRDIPMDVMAIVPGGTSHLGDLTLPVGLTGCVAGRVTDNGTPGEGAVDITGPENLSVPLDAGGGFFVNGLPAGSWVASYHFAGDPAPRAVPFLIPPGGCVAVNVQRSAGSGMRDIEVLVVLDLDEAPETDNPPVPGALVQLFGADAGSSAGILGFTGPDGIARFEDVDGPFFVTAQADITAPRTGARLRLTTTLPVIDPPSDGIGLFLGFEEPFRPTQTDATLSGQILNAPTLIPPEFLRMRVEGRGEQPFRGTTSPGGTYIIDVPSGEPLDTVIERLGPSPEPMGNPIPIEMVQLSLQSLAPFENRVQDYDFAFPNGVPFNQVVGLMVTQPHPAPEDPRVDLVGTGPGGEGVEFDLFSVPSEGLRLPDGDGDVGATHLGPFPDTVRLPDLGHPGLGGMTFELNVEQDAFTAPDLEHEFNCILALGVTTPGSISLTLPGAPGLTSPGPFTFMDVPTANTFTPAMTLPQGDSGLGVNLFVMFSTDGAPPGLDGAAWSIFLPATSTAATLRPPPREVFAENVAYGVEALTVRLPLPVDFDATFTRDVNANLREALTAPAFDCSAGSARLLFIVGGETL